MNIQEFKKLRDRGLLLNERAMFPLCRNAHIQSELIVWFVEFPDGTWLREDRMYYTKEALRADRFLTEKEALLFISHFRLGEFGATATEHEFVESLTKKEEKQ